MAPQAVDINTAGTAYGSQISFTTLTSDTTPPTVVSIVRQTPTGQSTTANTPTFRVTFSEAVNAPATSKFAVAQLVATAERKTAWEFLQQCSKQCLTRSTPS